jgi:hypothetical protein
LPRPGEYAAALYVKRQRPAAKVGFYALPHTEYWKQDEQWTSAMRALQPIIDACDVVFPSIYDFYGKDPQRDRERFSAVIRLALELSRGKPVYMYAQHRYHNSTMRQAIRGLTSTSASCVEVNGHAPAGVVIQRHPPLPRSHCSLTEYFSEDRWDRIRAACRGCGGERRVPNKLNPRLRPSTRCAGP